MFIETMFNNCSSIEDMTGCFAEIENIRKIPNKLLTISNCPNIKHLDGCFYNTMRQMDIGTFHSSDVPELWKIYTASDITHEDCFTGCRVPNPNKVPEDWGKVESCIPTS